MKCVQIVTAGKINLVVLVSNTIFAKMITKILEATCCIRKAEIEIINTEMDIFVEWDVDIDKREYQAQLQIIPKEVKGSFTYKHNYVDYKVSHKVTFAAMPDKWKIQCLHSNIAKFGIAMQPETVHIDFDNLKINITF